jgi:hypothetical protein
MQREIHDEDSFHRNFKTAELIFCRIQGKEPDFAKKPKILLAKIFQLVRIVEFSILKIYVKRRWGASYEMEARTN